jgi:N-acetylmuramoyl-L-alanine amidase
LQLLEHSFAWRRKPEKKNLADRRKAKLHFKNRQQMLICWSMCILFFMFFGSRSASECRAGDFKIAIDSGHTPNRPGAVSARGVPEYLFNQNIATLLYQKLLQDQRFKGSYLINEAGDDISLSARANLANRRGAALFVSIHHDSVEPKDLSHWLYQGKSMAYCDKFTGFSIFYSERNGSPLNSLIFAVVLGSEMLRHGFCPTLHHAEKFTGGDKELIDKTRGIYKYNRLVVLRSTDMPAVLLECGIIKNRDEEMQIRKAAYQHRIVEALVSAIKKFFML